MQTLSPTLIFNPSIPANLCPRDHSSERLIHLKPYKEIWGIITAEWNNALTPLPKLPWCPMQSSHHVTPWFVPFLSYSEKSNLSFSFLYSSVSFGHQREEMLSLMLWDFSEALLPPPFYYTDAYWFFLIGLPAFLDHNLKIHRFFLSSFSIFSSSSQWS